MQLENFGVLLESLYKHIDLWMGYMYVVPEIRCTVLYIVLMLCSTHILNRLFWHMSQTEENNRELREARDKVNVYFRELQDLKVLLKETLENKMEKKEGKEVKKTHIPLPLCLPKVTTGKNLNFPGEKYTMVLCNCILEFETYRENNKNEKCICVTREEEYIGLNSVKLVDFTHADNSPLLTKFRTDILRRIESRCGGEIVGGNK